MGAGVPLYEQMHILDFYRSRGLFAQLMILCLHRFKGPAPRNWMKISEGK